VASGLAMSSQKLEQRTLWLAPLGLVDESANGAAIQIA